MARVAAGATQPVVAAVAAVQVMAMEGRGLGHPEVAREPARVVAERATAEAAVEAAVEAGKGVATPPAPVRRGCVTHLAGQARGSRSVPEAAPHTPRARTCMLATDDGSDPCSRIPPGPPQGPPRPHPPPRNHGGVEALRPPPLARHVTHRVRPARRPPPRPARRCLPQAWRALVPMCG